MRLAPVPIRFGHLYADQLDEFSRLAEESSLPTHASETCLSACRYLTTVLAALIHGEDRDVVLSPDWQPLQKLNEIKPLDPLILEVAEGSFRHNQPPAIEGSGWVVKSLEAALWAFHRATVSKKLFLGPLTWEMTPTPRVQFAGNWAGRIGASRAFPDC